MNPAAIAAAKRKFIFVQKKQGRISNRQTVYRKNCLLNYYFRPNHLNRYLISSKAKFLLAL